MRPSLPVWRQITGVVGQALLDFRTFMATLLDNSQLWGEHVTVTFSGPGVATAVPASSVSPQHYVVTSATADIRVWTAAPPPDSDRSALWLEASGAGTVNLYLY